MKLHEKLSELGFVFDDGLWLSAGVDDSNIYVTEIDEGVQVCKMPEDGDQAAVVVRYNRVDPTLLNLLETWSNYDQ